MGVAEKIVAPVVVTLLGAALTVWIAPAFTKQWGDRQRARDLKAAIAQEMVASAGPIIRSVGPLVDGRGDYAATHQRWREDGVRVTVKLGAYFPAKTVEEWKAALLRGDLLLIASDDARDARSNPIASRRQRIANSLKLLGLDARHADQTAVLLLAPKTRELGVDDLGQWMWASLGQTIDAIFAAHPNGFSTTRRDLFHDVLP